MAHLNLQKNKIFLLTELKESCPDANILLASSFSCEN